MAGRKMRWCCLLMLPPAIHHEHIGSGGWLAIGSLLSVPNVYPNVELELEL